MTQLKTMQRKLSKKMKTGYRCPFCGGFTTNPQEYYSSLATILLMRFVDLLNSSKDPAYQEAVLDSIHAVFGVDNRVARKELVAAGFLGVFDRRHKYINDLNSHNKYGGKQNGSE